jgi:hypothetical protein
MLVLHAGRMVREALGKDKDDLRHARNSLVKAAEQAAAGGYKSFNFAPGNAETVDDSGLADDLLASVLVDINSASVVVAAGYAVEAPQQNAGHLDDALQALEAANGVLQSAGDSTTFGFRASLSARAKTHSSDLKAAVASFGKSSTKALDQIVAGSELVVTDILAELKKVDPDKVLDALGTVGEKISGLTEAAGQLVRKGLDLLQAALNRLVNGFGSKMLNLASDKLKKIWDDVRSGKYTRQTLALTFGIEATKAAIVAILGKPDLNPAAVDRGIDELDDLTERFGKHVKLMRGILRGLTVGLALIAFGGVSAPATVLAGASAYAVVLAAIILIGMDFSDSGHVLQWVKGVGQIANGL